MCILSETIRGRQGWETSGEMQKKNVEHDFIFKQQEDAKGLKEQRQTRNTNKNMMKTYDW